MDELELTAADVRRLLDAQQDRAVLYVKLGPDDEGGEPELDVWVDSEVSHLRVVLRKPEVVDALGDDPDEEDIETFLASCSPETDDAITDILSREGLA